MGQYACSRPDNGLLARLRKKELEQKQMETIETINGSKMSMAYSTQVQPKGKQFDRKSSIEALKKRTNCKACGKKGHWAKECRNPTGSDLQPASLLASSQSDEYFAFMAYTNEDGTMMSDIWVSDSGATQHINGQKFTMNSMPPKRSL